MTKGLYIVASEPQAGKSLLSFCLIRLLQHHFPRIGFYRPITTTENPEDHLDPSIQAACDFFKFTKQQAQKMYGLPFEQAEKMLCNNQRDAFINSIIKRYKNIEQDYDVIISEGCDFHQHPSILEFDINADIANNLNNQIIVIVNGHNKSLSEIEKTIGLTIETYKKKQCRLFSIIVNRVVSVQTTALKSIINNSFADKIPFLGIIPEKDILSKPNMADIAHHLSANICWGQSQIKRMVNQTLIAAKHPSEFLAANYPQDNTLIITPGDRADTIMSCLLADQSEHYPPIAGMILTTGVKPSATIARILDGLEAPFPILSTSKNTFAVAASLHQATFPTAIFHEEKIHCAIEHVSQSLDEHLFVEQLKQPVPPVITPNMFEYMLCSHAQKCKKRIVLAEGEDLRILKACERLILRNCVKITLLGRRSIIEKISQKNNISIPGVQIIDPKNSERQEEYAEFLYQQRKHKGMTLEIAKELILEEPYFATIMVALKHADGMVCGAMHTTRDTLRPALQIIKTKPQIKKASSLFVMCMSQRILIYADCAITPNPNAEELAEIAIQAAITAKTLGIKPKIAMLSYSSGQSADGKSVEKVRKATAIIQQSNPDLEVEGPIQYDAAVNPQVAATKMPNSKIAGIANILVFPDLNSGNNTYKAVARESGATAIGPILLGLKKPINDLSRGCKVDDIVSTILITAIQASQNND